jgi:hypothetical protein
MIVTLVGTNYQLFRFLFVFMKCNLNCWEHIEKLQPGSIGEVADGPGASAGEGP